MLAAVSERKMKAVRFGLAAGWLLLIAALFVDPARIPVGAPGNLGPAGFAWWSIVIPLLPVSLLVFGHEAWRRICPLSALSQIPRLLGLQRTRKVLNPETGAIERKLVMIAPGSWLARNSPAVQFGLLWAAVSLRLVLINQDRFALGVFLLGVVAAALVAGYLFGGKTWCHYVCPIAPVQTFYTEPRGLLESRQHLGLRVITGSMCRSTDQSGRELSACVGCRSPCADVDLERAYWHDLDAGSKQVVYYGYAGLVIGYAAWNGGFLRLPLRLPGPLALAAPATLLFFILATLGAGVLLERFYLAARRQLGAPLTPGEARHQAFALTTFATFNLFYLVGARPLLAMLPDGVRSGAQFLVVFFSSLWMVQALGRSSPRYERESVGASLRKQLKKLKLDLGRVLAGRSLDDLEPEEVYLLAKALPELTSQQKRDTYKETVREALRSGAASSASGLGVLFELRSQLAISEAEHGEVLTELGVEDRRLLDPEEAQSQETWLRLESYREALEALVLDLVKRGAPLQEAMRRADVQDQIRALQALYGIVLEDQQKVAAELLGAGGRLSREVQELILRVTELGARALALMVLHDGPAAEPARLLLVLNAGQRRAAVLRALNLLSASGPTPEAIDAAEALARVAPDEIDAALAEPLGPTWRDWSTELGPGVLAVLSRRGAAAPHSGIRTGPVVALQSTVYEHEPIARAVALQALALLEPGLALDEAQPLLESSAPQHWLVQEVARAVAAADGAAPILPALERVFRLSSAQLFQRLAPESLADLARDASTRGYALGEPLCVEGEPSHDLLVLSRGAAEVELTRDGVARVVARLKPGVVIGELGVLTHAPRTATVRASEPGTEVVTIQGARLEALLLQDGRVATGLLRTVAQRLVQTLGQLGR